MKRKSFLRILFMLIAGLLALGQLQKIFITPSINIFFHEIFMIVYIMLLFPDIWSFLRHTKKHCIVMYGVLFLAYIFFGITMRIAWEPISTLFVGYAYALRLALYMTFTLSTYISLQKHIFTNLELEHLLVGSVATIAIIGLIQFFLIPDLRVLRYAGWDDHYLRLASSLLDPSFTGIVLFLGMVVAFFRMLAHKTRSAFSVFVLICIAMLLTYSRGTYLALLGWGIMCAVYTPKMRKLLFICLIMGSTGILLLPRPASEGARLERFTSIQARLINISTTLFSMKTEDWIFGKGWYMAMAQRQTNNTVTSISHSSSPDNSFIHVLQSTGILGFGIFYMLLGAIWKRITHVGRAVFIGVCIASLFSQILFYPFVMIFFPYTLYVYRKKA